MTTHADETRALIAAIEACLATTRGDNREVVPYDGPEPDEPWMTARECDRRAGVEDHRRWRQLP